MCVDKKESRCLVPPEDEQVDLAVEVFRMLADATRVRLLWVLLPGEASVDQLAEAVAKPQTAVSQHLASCAWPIWSRPAGRGRRCSTAS